MTTRSLPRAASPRGASPRAAASPRAGALLLLAALALAGPGAAPGAAQVPAPRDVLGFVPGTDYKLATYDQIAAYFQALDRASDRVVVERIGESVLGKPMLLALISSERNLRDRERYRDIARRLAHARGLTDEQARALAKEGKAIVWIDGGLHATEVAHGQMTPELAHWLATDESDEARRIRDDAILLLMPNMNPDGLDLVADWYRRNLGTPFETAPIPVLYHHYIGHDNNRDWYMFTQPETRAVARQLYHVWFPQIVYNHHQSGPFPGRIWVPPFENPVNPNLDPLVVSSINQIGEAMRRRFDEEGKPGVSSGIVYDMWWNGSMRGAPDFHNMLGFLTETALHSYATPHCYPPESIPETFGARAGNLPARTPSTSYNNPWMGGCWPLRMPVEYMLTASRAVLDMASKNREDYLFNIYRMGKRQIARGERAEGGPYAYVVDPAAHHDPGAVVEFLRTLRTGGVEIRRADRAFRAGGKEYAAGVYVIGPQAFRPYVVDLMEPKSYPDRRQYPDGPPEPPYDMTGYELSLQMGVRPDRVAEPFPLPATVVDEVPAAPGGARGTGSAGYLLSHAHNAAVTAANRLMKEGASVSWLSAPASAAGRSWPAGTYLVRGAAREKVDALGKELGLEFHALDAAPAAVQALRPPRIGLYRSHTANMPEGWTRWVLERHGFAYRTLTDADLRRGDLSGLDVVILPDQGAASILNGHAPGTLPPEFTGGVGAEGALALKRFVEGGGWLVAFDAAVDFAIAHLGLPVRNVVADLRPQEFFIPGSLIRVRTDPADPLAYGMPEDAIAMFAGSQVLDVIPAAGAGDRRAPRDAVVYARYAARDFLASGWAHGAARYLAGRAAAVRVPAGRGQAVLLAFTPHFRGQPHNTYKLLFNPLLAAASEGGVGRAAAGGR